MPEPASRGRTRLSNLGTFEVRYQNNKVFTYHGVDVELYYDHATSRLTIRVERSDGQGRRQTTD